jgi:hypothetical protein
MTISSNSLSITLPDGQKASFKEMQAYGNCLQDFIRDQESKLPQIEDTRLHNETVEYLKLLATSYNKQLRIYKAQEAQNQRQFMIGLKEAERTARLWLTQS